MKFKNIFFDFFKTLLLVVVFYSGLLYADQYMFLDLQNYPYISNDFRPYFFERDLATGNLIRVPDVQNSFQFKTYNLESLDDAALYRVEVRPVLLEWRGTIAPLDSEADSASFLSGSMADSIDFCLKEKLPLRKVHIVTYRGNVEAVSYVNNADPVPKIELMAANPEGMLEGQTAIVKGGGSSLLEGIVRGYQAEGRGRVRLYSINDKYYSKRGWQAEPNRGACGNTPPF
ncbi:hypothetical protein [Bathymodiolus thermophilus thioautotrophic gill symbiont]|uniref:Uncharacterized protein n=1 Tax=Bathymodiolus thermophilus thioautotrophic gill symbiont TaxID=2360 RepID=A0A8H9CH47_9GAMM|nr:hypothetical protein [Bathymodiolus thermophilus thioautotrophic gill symbiont]CAB5498074.1 hypothetical protein THERMOS_779 [Bathymodiolus thermophilus thioautotrophic gill symbiont]